MYADDIVLLSTTPAGLQGNLTELHRFCEDWCLEVNVTKYNFMICNESGRLLENKFYFYEEILKM